MSYGALLAWLEELTHDASVDNLPPARCCGGARTHPSAPATPRGTHDSATPRIVLEDQNGANVGYDEYFSGQPSIVVFFYTRCTNPQKCSLTVTKLGRLREALRVRALAGRIRTAAITYDPAYDDRDRLLGYARNRNVLLDDNHRILRVVQGWEVVRKRFELGVNFVGSIVNRHRVEAFVLDAQGRIAASFERLQWDDEEVIDEAVRLLARPPDDTGSDGDTSGDARPNDLPTSLQGSEAPMRTTTISACCGVLASIAMAFFPRCPMCWAAYLSALGIGNLEFIEYDARLIPVLAALMVANLISLLPRERSRRRWFAFALAAAGALLVLAGNLWPQLPDVRVAGVVLTAAGSLIGTMTIPGQTAMVSQWWRRLSMRMAVR